MIDLLTGKPGGGKGLYAMKLIIDELVKGSRPVITNLAVRLDPWVNKQGIPQIGLRAYLKTFHGGTFNVDQRLLILEDEQVPHFFCQRLSFKGEKSVHIKCALRKGHDGKDNEFDTETAMACGGVFYVIDEAWKFWSARGWKDTGDVTLFYVAQHRKMGDDVIICCQSAKQLDTAIRQVSQSFLVVRNHSIERFGLFRQPDMFTVRTFGELPTPNSVVQCTSVFKLNKAGIGGCYDTSAGVGVTGMGAADTGKRKKGWPLWLIVPALGVGIVIVLYVPHVLTKRYFGGLKPDKLELHHGTNAVKAVVQEVAKTNHVVPSFEERPPQPQLRRRNSEDATFPSPVPQLAESTEICLTGITRSPINGQIKIMLSDGRTFSAADSEVGLITDKFVVIEGKVFRWPVLGNSGSVPVARPKTLNKAVSGIATGRGF